MSIVAPSVLVTATPVLNLSLVLCQKTLPSESLPMVRSSVVVGIAVGRWDDRVNRTSGRTVAAGKETGMVHHLRCNKFRTISNVYNLCTRKRCILGDKTPGWLYIPVQDTAVFYFKRAPKPKPTVFGTIVDRER